jgi:hypothetical protein
VPQAAILMSPKFQVNADLIKPHQSTNLNLSNSGQLPGDRYTIVDERSMPGLP